MWKQLSGGLRYIEHYPVGVHVAFLIKLIWSVWGVMVTLVAMVTLTGSAAIAQDTTSIYPNRPIRIIVTFPPGGPTDIIARTVGQKLAESWGQPVVVDNRPGAGGNIGTDLVAKAAPDGYTLVLSNLGPFAISPGVYAKLPYDPVKDLAPITLAATGWFFMVVNATSPATSVKELIALAKAKPDSIAFSSSGNASPSHLAGALFQSSAGIRLTHVPYKGGAPAVAAVMGGEVQMAIESPPPIVPQVKAGKLRALGAARANRSPLLPDVPTVSEAGLPGFEVGSWYGFHAPAGTPKPIIDKLHMQMVKAMNLPEMRERFSSVGAETIASTPAHYGTFVQTELKKWSAVIKATGVKID
jgi:tripartite-type tricarboxylate transporter receptor subunit TctC